ncbi:hypothetical protein A3I27_04520 [Candidatus Giovannonibacteria bacterium RIFCSPLOWO2_02_FULL_43_11b]|uniref:Uncharacterized protein n=1 Tax=Candidatus Giovannonibacteria bacterium RIFCSPHIGHO2_12_FULL_43_15 TaxID=1798341 RepID=A0A1F5WPF4_9BACT|nr:MAG: hypothetical protein A2739_01550 [Candidatus Giovannonibacteria bacterium RIFCSPHIGHO2_01_FULL_43_100]OGF66753.1 MAG: hypothetical protein A3B97_02460 [Candidatus Giovannonibacteria bacterium RIFCSPHIGHO2_02_FULL_43_32]OGF77529.1 MAG: hypothetical protein A3F23_00955 [Candidatus Giovannonibacteria bacterium RIFCSPHIGHO2_12_FULL_43_15]OGF78990.1 MAG: hypothetical protein A3A15_00580 [Candidatus Giovannonibacteria bacterium RIFCSPLOWO2_01_FULL_43_60]OGF89973.1 MAG: hypothetical protein A3
MVFVRVENFLSKFKKLETKEGRENKVCEILKGSIPADGLKIAVRKKTIYFYDLSPAAKSEIFFKKEEILEKVKKVMKEAAPNEISFRKP